MGRDRRATGRRVAVAALAVALLVALWHQRATVGDAVDEVVRLDRWILVALATLTIADRVVRGATMRRAVGARCAVHGVVLHDVGAAASYGLPGGGLVGTAMRYRVARGADIPAADFLAGVTAFGVAMSAASWLLPVVVLGAEVLLLDAGLVDVALLALSVGVLGAAAGTWVVVLRSERLFERGADVAEGLRRRAARRVGRLSGTDLRPGLVVLRERLRECVPRLPALLAGAVLAQLVAGAVLLVALVGLGAGPELGVVEFARVFFVTRVLSSLVPTPGGVGVVEAGLTAALVAAGVPVAPAVGAVLVYRLATFLVPIVTGTACWLLWARADRRTVASGAGDGPTTFARCAGGGSNMLAGVTEGRDHAAWTHPHVDPALARRSERAVEEDR